MKLQTSELNEVIGIDQEFSTAMTIDDSDKNILMLILSQNLYSDPIGSIVREYTTNALDSHREANVEEPIKVSLLRENGHYVFSVEDFGVGLSEERVEKIFSKYLASTKRGSNTQLGAYGIGSKSALSYTDSFTIRSRYNGFEYLYLMFKGEEGTQLSLTDMCETTEQNGVKISIILKNDHDYYSFLDKMKAQLCYFEGVFINTVYNDIDSDYKIIKTPLWKFSELNEDQMLHLSLDNVYYPLDFSKLNIEPIKMPIGLVFSLNDGIMPTPNRESFMYTPAVKELILNRIKEVGNYFCDKWNALVPIVETYEEAKNLRSNLYEVSIYQEKTLSTEKNIKIKIPKNITKYCNSRLNGVALSLYPSLDIEQLEKINRFLFQEYQVVGEFDEKYTTKIKNSYVVNWNNILFLDKGEQLSKLQIQYLRWSENHIRVVRKHIHLKLGITKSYNNSYDNYYGLLNLAKVPKGEWRKTIQDYQALQKSYVDKWQHIDDIVPTQEFLDWKEANKVRQKRVKLGVEEIKVYIGREPLTGRAKKEVIYEPVTFKISELGKKELNDKKQTFIYADEDRENELNTFLDFLDYKIVRCNIKTYRTIKKLNLHNWIPVEDVLTKRNKTISKIVTNFVKESVLATRIHEFYTSTIDIINIVNPKITAKVKKLLAYDYSGYNYRLRRFTNQIYKLYIKNRWFDYNIWDDIKTVYENLPKLAFTKDVGFLHKENPYYLQFIKLVWNDYKTKEQTIKFEDFLTEVVNKLN